MVSSSLAVGEARLAQRLTLEAAITRMIMEFSMKEWRNMYDKVHGIGKMLRDSRPTYNEHGNYYAPKTELSKDAQIELEFQIKTWMERNTLYLNQCGMNPKKPLWHYD